MGTLITFVSDRSYKNVIWQRLIVEETKMALTNNQMAMIEYISKNDLSMAKKAA